MPISGLGMGEMIFIFVIVLLLFGAKRLPEIGSSLGKGIREFKSSVREIEHELKTPDRQIHKSSPPPPRAEAVEVASEPVGSDSDDGEPRSLTDD